jgi:hypothetical protein
MQFFYQHEIDNRTVPEGERGEYLSVVKSNRRGKGMVYVLLINLCMFCGV